MNRARRICLLVVLGLVVAATSVPMASAAAPQPEPIGLESALAALQQGQATNARLAGPTGGIKLTFARRGHRYEIALPTPQLVSRALQAAERGRVDLQIIAAPVRSAADLRAEIQGEQPGGVRRALNWVWANIGTLLLGALVIVSIMAVRQVGGGRGSHRVRPSQSSVRFDEVAGIDEIRDEVSEISDYLRDPTRFRSLGAVAPKGVILHGAPGTGKTLLARAIANEAGVAFFSASASEFVEVYAGVGARRVRRLFEAARKAAPAVVYIDEIDAVGTQRGGGPGTSEREQTLDQLLTEMDGFSTDAEKPVVVMASTNRLDALDPALVRSGRFDRKIAVGLPGRQARQEILQVHTRRRPLAPETDLADIAAYTAGLAGADLAALCNEASFEAARAGAQSLSPVHFRRALMRLAAGPEKRHQVLSEDERRVVAYHEVGHALVGHLLPGCDVVERVTVIPQGQALGVTISLPEEDRFLATREDLSDRLRMLLAGRAAEEIFFDSATSGAADDLRRAQEIARRMAGEWAMGEGTTLESLAPEDGERLEATRDRQAGRLLRDAYADALEILRDKRDLVDAAAERLLASEAIEREDLLELFGPRPTRLAR